MTALALPLIELLKITRPPASKQSGVNFVVIVGVVSGIITIAGAFIGIARIGEKGREKKINRRVNELVAKQLDAEKIEQSAKAAKAHAERVQDELARLNDAKETLGHQISQIPQEVDRLLRISQLEQLATRISRDFKEYISIQQDLQGTGTAGALDVRIRDVIEHEILPMQRRVDRRNTYIFVLVVLLLALSLSPIRASDLVYNYFSILGNSPNWTSDSPIWMIAIGGSVIALLFLAASSLSSRLERYMYALGRSFYIIGLSLPLILTIALGYYWRDDALAGACAPYACGYPAFPYTAASIAFNVAPILGGLLLISIVSLARNRYRKPKLFTTPYWHAQGPT